MTGPVHPGPIRPGRLYGVGVGPGDPDLITVKALKVIQSADVVAYLAARHGRSNARAIVAGELTRGQRELTLIYPLTTETTDHPDGYDGAIAEFYDEAARTVAAELDAGRNVAVLCEGDPFFYGSYMYLHDRLAQHYETEVVPGVPSIMAGAARLGRPLVRRDTELAILPGTLPEAELARRLAHGQAAAIMKLGRNFAKVRRAIETAGAADRALYIERATMAAERIVPLHEVDPAQVPYFSLVLVPGAEVVPVKCAPGAAGQLIVLGLGPGAPEWLSPEAREALADATDLVGYQPYLDRVPPQPGQIRHGSDNRVEAARARHALELATAGRRVCVVSSGDPGIFAMASAVLEQVEAGPATWRALDIRIVPGISAMQAAAARVGAPLGHDFCVISLSDRLKPWPTIVERLDAAARADFALALYNPISSERQWQLGEARSVLLRHRAPETPVIVARDVGGAGERITVTDLKGLDPAEVDMRTILLIGNSQTRRLAGVEGRPLVYTPRRYGV
ncbi:precorrin-3B C(17)-methyltransferase [Aliidongia dinghuensis]|uniref:Precorrin-3B C(17)-methyltransferase n=1 Tax=Aliidongia dinghuensis TaxID=1867774 RepID=A0A8J2YQQ9_9PROT|nr:precorrin-2 C(20)-methyltransferase [Aliidongia dinghuensis]GGF06084.1 precorrin-3B C(17)-methyltransferase [Aliidongia dinghuensis]